MSAKSNSTQGAFPMKRALLFAVLAVVVAIPTQAAQVCETEIQELVRMVKLGGHPTDTAYSKPGADVRELAISRIKSVGEESCVFLNSAVEPDGRERIAKREAWMEKDGMFNRNDKHSLNMRARLAGIKLLQCAYEAAHVRKCKGPSK